MSAANEIQHGGTHYKGTGDYQHWDMAEDYGLPYLEGIASKYLSRWWLKGGAEDLNKCSHCLVKILERSPELWRAQSMRPWKTQDDVRAFCLAAGLNMPETAIMVDIVTGKEQQTIERALERLQDYIDHLTAGNWDRSQFVF